MNDLPTNNKDLRKFITRAALFGCILMALLAIAEVCLRSRPSSYSLKEAYIHQHGDDITTLILGSSHTYYGLNPEWIADSCFNLANISQSPEYDFELLRKNISYLPNLRRVIIPISYFTFTDPLLEDSDEWYLCINYKINMDIGGHSDLSKYNFTISHFPSFNARLKNALRLDSTQNRCDSLGFGLGYTLDNRNPNWDSFAARRVAELTRQDSPRRQEVRECLDSMLYFCSRNNIDPLIIITPVWHTFRQYADSTQLTLMRREANELAWRHNVTLLDLYDSPLFSADDFFDTDHLSVNGAERLSNIIREKIDSDRPNHLVNL